MPIINGVEVEECQYKYLNEYIPKYECNLSYHKRKDGYMAFKDCEQIPNCYFKQLQRLKKENEELKQTLEEIREIAKERNYLSFDEALDDILDKIDEVLR